jgi:NADPH:quinone reductase-like Zn-dependent oxidoreductase
VGALTIQLASHVFGPSCVVATASPGEKTELCKYLGADEVVNYHSEKFYEKYANDPFDVCFNTTDESLQMIGVIKDGGMIMTIAGKPTFESIQAAAGGNPGVSSAW